MEGAESNLSEANFDNPDRSTQSNIIQDDMQMKFRRDCIARKMWKQYLSYTGKLKKLVIFLIDNNVFSTGFSSW